jgi:hypothetical protein
MLLSVILKIRSFPMLLDPDFDDIDPRELPRPTANQES